MSFTPELLVKSAEQAVGGATLASLGLFPSLFVKQAADLTVSGTGAQNTDLSLALEASATYHVTGGYIYDGGTTGDFKHFLSFPGAGWLNFYSYVTTAGTAVTEGLITASGGGIATGALGAGSKLAALMVGIIDTTTAGTLQYQAAQNATDATVTKLYARSFLRAQRVA